MMNPVSLIIVPALTALFILAIRNSGHAKWIALGGAVVQMGLSAILCYRYLHLPADSKGVMAFQQSWPFFPTLNISFHFGVDGISLAMILLTSLVVAAGILVSWNVDRMKKEFFFLLTLLAAGAYGFFISLDLFVLFFFLEVAVIPKYLLIAIWGSGKKEYSANKLALMLMGASALVLVGMLGLYYGSSGDAHSFDLVRLGEQSMSAERQRLFFPFLFLGFGVFTALFPFHTWVPDGHSSAPTAGSMFLAGISMKLGGYGCLRVAVWLMPDAAREYSPYIIILSAIAILYGAFATMMQKDLKYMNAYSSISHCGFVLLGTGMLTHTAINGAVVQMVSHGLMTALFFAVIGMVYARTHTRVIGEMSGLMRSLPFIMTVFFLSGLCSLGLPGLSGFVAEMTVFMGSWEHPDLFHRAATVTACLSIVVTAVYILRATGQVAMGPASDAAASFSDASWNEKAASVLLLGGIFAIGLMPSWLNALIEPSITVMSTRLGIR